MDPRSSFFVKSSWRSFSSLSSPSPPPPPPPGPDEDKRSSVSVPRWVDTLKGIDIDPYNAVSKVEEEEGRYVITFTVGTGRNGRPIERVEYVAKKHPVSSIERDLRLLKLSSSSSYDSLSPPPQFPFPWAAAAEEEEDSIGVKILSFDEITSKLGIMEIRGEVECTNCHQSATIGLDLKTEFSRIYYYVDYSSLGGFFRCNHWINPILKTPCPSCGGTGRLKPVIPENDIDYRKINWLFLLLDQMLGFCSVEQLNLFCKHNSTRDCVYREYCGAKDHLLYLTYVTLCNQLFPTGPLNDPNRIL